MAYNIVSSAEFKPISYSDIVAPLVQYRDEYQRVEDIYSQLLEKTLPWKAELEGYAGSDAYNTYNNFYNELNAAMEDFSKGMTTENAKGLLKLKRRHLSDIYPIERAVKKIDEWEKFKADIKRSNPHAEFAQDSVSIDDIIKGVKPNKDYWDGNAAMQRVTAKAAALAKSLYSNPIDKGLWLGNQYHQIETLNGMPVEEFMAVLQDPRNADTEAAKMMGKILTDELDLIDKNSFSNQTYNRILNTLNTAMYAGLANPKYENVVNQNFMDEYKRTQLKYMRDNHNWETKERKKLSGEIPFYTRDNGDGTKTEYRNNPATGKVEEFTVDSGGNKTYVGVSPDVPYYGDNKNDNINKTDVDKANDKAYKEDVNKFVKTKASVKGDDNTIVVSDGGNTITYYYSSNSKPQSKNHDMSKLKEINFEDLPEGIQKALKDYPKTAFKIWKDTDWANPNDYKIVVSLDNINSNYAKGDSQTSGSNRDKPAGID